MGVFPLYGVVRMKTYNFWTLGNRMSGDTTRWTFFPLFRRFHILKAGRVTLSAGGGWPTPRLGLERSFHRDHCALSASRIADSRAALYGLSTPLCAPKSSATIFSHEVEDGKSRNCRAGVIHTQNSWKSRRDILSPLIRRSWSLWWHDAVPREQWQRPPSCVTSGSSYTCIVLDRIEWIRFAKTTRCEGTKK